MTKPPAPRTEAADAKEPDMKAETVTIELSVLLEIRERAEAMMPFLYLADCTLAGSDAIRQPQDNARRYGRKIIEAVNEAIREQS